MFLRCKVRRKDGKEHRYWSVVENTRVSGGRVVQRHVLYLGEINDTQELAWRRSIEVLEEGATQPRTLSLFPRRPLRRSAGERLDRPRQAVAVAVAPATAVGCVLAGWRCCCGASCSSISSGRSGWGRAAKERTGIRSCSCWLPIACWRRAANGGCTASGFGAVPWPICWARTQGWPKSTSCTAVTTGCWCTSRRSLIT